MSFFPAWRIFIAAILFFLIANLIFLDWVMLNDRPSGSATASTQINPDQLSQVVDQLITNRQEEQDQDPANQCTPLCRRYFDTQLNSVVATLSGEVVEKTTETPTSTTTIITSPATANTTGTFYVPIGGSGSTTNQTWTDTSAEVIINWDNYPGDKVTVTWEGYVKLKDGNGLASARLYDVTHQVAVPGSELETSYWDFKYIASGPLTIWSGNVTYRVQIKSLTGYQAWYEGGKIKIVIE
jgi:hypothetical protein